MKARPAGRLPVPALRAQRPVAWLLDLASAALVTAMLGVTALALVATGQFAPTSVPPAPAAGRALDGRGPPWRPEATVFVAFGTPVADTRALESRLAAIDGVAGVRFVPRDEALAALNARADTGTSGVVAALKSNPLPDAYVLRLDAAALPERIEAALAAARRLPRVDAVDFDTPAWVRGHHLEAVARGAGGLLVAVSVVVLAGLAVRLAGAATPFDPVTVRTLRLVGATDRQIAWPAVLTGAVGFALASAAGMAISLIATTLVAPRLALLAAAFGLPWTWPLPATVLAGAFVVMVAAATAAGALLGTLAGAASARRIVGP